MGKPAAIKNRVSLLQQVFNTLRVPMKDTFPGERMIIEPVKYRHIRAKKLLGKTQTGRVDFYNTEDG